MPDPIDLELARLRSHADQLRSTIRDALRDMEPARVAELVRTCAKGDLSGLDERTVAIIAWLGLVGFFGLFEKEEH